MRLKTIIIIIIIIITVTMFLWGHFNTIEIKIHTHFSEIFMSNKVLKEIVNQPPERNCLIVFSHNFLILTTKVQL